MAIIPLEEIKNQLMQGNLSLTQSILGPHCYAQLSGLFDQQEFSFAAFKYLPNVGGQANSPLGSLAGVNQISFDGTLTVLGRFMWKDVPVRFSLFDRDTQSAPERHAVLKIEIPPKLEANADLQEYRAGADITSLIAYVQEDGGADNTSPIAKSAESMIDLYVENLVLGEKAVIFSSLDYSVGFDQIYPTGFEELVPANEIRAGLNLPLQITINSDVSAIFGDLLAGFPLEGQIPGHGVVCQSDSIPYLIVGRTINAELTLGLLKLKLDRFGLGFALIEAGDMAPQVIIDGSIGFGSQSCTVEADYDLYHRTLALAFRAFPSLRTLLSEMGNTDEYFPKPFDILLEIQLSKLEIIFDLNARSVRELSLSVTTEHDIELIDNIISIKPTLDLDIYDPFDADSRSLEGMLTGIWELGSTKFETTLTYPTYDFHAAMAEGESLDLAALAEKVFGMPLPKISITGMELVGNFNDKSFSINLVVASDWKIKLAADKTLDLKQVQLSMRYADHQREYEAACVLTLAGVDLFIWAHYAKSWQFNGSTGPGQKIPIGRLMGDLENLFGIDADLPDSLEALTISNLAMSYDSTGFSFGCETEFKVDGQPVDMVITITIKKVEPKKPEKSEQPKKSEVLEKSTRTKSTSKKNDEGSYTKDFDGHLTVAGRKFNLSCHKEAGASRMVASYRKDGGDRIELRDLIGGDLGEQIPESLAITIDDVYLAYCKEGIAEQDDVKKSAAKGKSAVTGKEKAAAAFSGFLLGADLKASIQLSDIPLAGESLPAGLTAGVDQLRVLLASNSFQATHLKGINEELTKAGIAELKLPGELGEAKAEGEADEVVVGKGLSLSAVLTLGESKRAISLTTAKSKSAESGKGDGGKKTPEVAHDIAAPASDNSVITPAAETSLAASAAADTTPAATKPGGSATWITLDKKLGPVEFNRIGLQYQNSALWVLLDVVFSNSGLTLSLDGLGVGSPLSEFKPEFKLDGIGLDYKGSGGLEIGGAFLHEKVTKTDPVTKKDQTFDQYSGVALIKTEALKLSAMGSYAEMDGYTSMFVYAFLDKPLGGPAFFFVNGLAAGFGYNRALKSPTKVEEIESFPLVSIAMGGNPVGDVKDETSALLDILSSLGSYIPPAPNRYFLALGIKFNSFKLIDSFALLVATFGDEFRIKLLGLSKIVAPPAVSGKSPIAEVTIGLIAEFIPDDELLKIDGKIMPGSYVLSHDCQLTGDFAFYSWFSGPHSGDFVLSVGGYHPSFHVPAHYPSIERLALNWQIDSDLSVKGTTYFALTSCAVMAGGHLEARLDKGRLQAWFDLKADFLVCWQPFHYDIGLSIEIGASYRTFLGTVSASLGAGVHIWGPEFAGTAHVHFIFVSFNVSFGATGIQKPPPLTWLEFKTSFLPPDKDICTIAVKDGLSRTKKEADAPGGERWLINPKHFALSIDSVIPVKKATGKIQKDETLKKLNGFPSGKSDKLLGIGSMELSELESTLTISAIWDGEDCLDKFRFAPVLKSVPAALWGPKREADLNGKPIRDVLCGFEVRPAGHPKPGDTNDIKCSVLRYNIDNREPGPPEQSLLELTWRKPAVPEIVSGKPAHKEELRKILKPAQRSLQAMCRGKDDDPFDLTLDKRLIDEFLEQPQLTSN